MQGNFRTSTNKIKHTSENTRGVKKVEQSDSLANKLCISQGAKTKCGNTEIGSIEAVWSGARRRSPPRQD